MKKKFYNIKDFPVSIEESRRPIEKGLTANAAATGVKSHYDVFLSHSTKDKELIRRIRNRIEKDYEISVYIDWDEDYGTSRDEASAAVRSAMKCSSTLIVVKTDNSDASAWVPWEIGYFDHKATDRIGVLIVEDEEQDFTAETFERREYLKDYVLLGVDDVPDFVKDGKCGVELREKRQSSQTPQCAVPTPTTGVRPYRNA